MGAPNLRAGSPAEVKDELEATRRGIPFLVYRHIDGRRRLVPLPAERGRLTIGRAPSNDLAIPWDPLVSRVHAQLERVGSAWALSDEGLSRNGSYVNGARIPGRRRLRDGDAIRVGSSLLIYRGAVGETDPTLVALAIAGPPALSEIQRRVLLALARPCRDYPSLNAPASNQQIAAELFYSIDAVKAHLRVLFHKFGLDGLPQNQKRLKLVDQAFQTGTISPRDF